MKISEYIHLKWFLIEMFSFFHERHIHSCRKEDENLDNILITLLESEFIEFSYIPSIQQYNIDFNINHDVTGSEVYTFLFGNRRGKNDNLFLVDLAAKERISFITVSFTNEKHLPFVRDFLDNQGNLKGRCLEKGDRYYHCSEKDIMTYDEFHEFLNNNNTQQKKINIIEVD